MSKLEQSIISLIKLEGISYQDVAKLMNISVNTVHTQIEIAMKKLRQSLEKQEK